MAVAPACKVIICDTSARCLGEEQTNASSNAVQLVSLSSGNSPQKKKREEASGESQVKITGSFSRIVGTSRENPAMTLLAHGVLIDSRNSQTKIVK